MVNTSPASAGYIPWCDNRRVPRQKQHSTFRTVYFCLTTLLDRETTRSMPTIVSLASRVLSVMYPGLADWWSGCPFFFVLSKTCFRERTELLKWRVSGRKAVNSCLSMRPRVWSSGLECVGSEIPKGVSPPFSFQALLWWGRTKKIVRCFVFC